MHKKAFTLIEVLVVLSLLALIAILAYNMFGSTLRDATVEQQAIEIYRQMDAIENAYLEYTRRTNDFDPLASYTHNEFEALLEDSGILREFPKPEASWEIATCSRPGGHPTGNAGWYFDTGNYGASTDEEFMYYLYCIKESICTRFNELYTDLGSDTSVSHGAVEEHGGRMCNCNFPDTDKCLVLGIAELN